MERVRRVLQHQLHEARGQLEPMDTELTSMKEQITELNKEYTSGMRAAAVLERKTKTSGQRQNMLQRELSKQENVVSSLRSTILKFSRDVENIVTAPGSNPGKWAEGLLTLYREYVTNLPVKGKIRGPGEDTMKEFDRQRMFMEKTVKALKKQSGKSQEMVVATKKRVASENTILVIELNELRKTVKRLQNNINRLETEKLQRESRRSSSMRKRQQQQSNHSNTLQFSKNNNNNNNNTNNNNNNNRGTTTMQTSHSQSQVSASDGGSSMLSSTSAPSTTSSTTSSVNDRNRSSRSSALQQVAKTHFATRGRDDHNTNAASTGRRPASAVAGAAGARPKSGGRPLTAQERRRRMPIGPSLSRSMSQLRASKSEKTLSVVQNRLDEAYMRDKVKNMEIQNLKNQLNDRNRRNRQLENMVSGKRHPSGSGSVISNGGRLMSPGSASILSEYSKTSTAPDGQEELAVVNQGLNEPTSPTTHDKKGNGRHQVLSPLAQRQAVKSSLRVG